MARRPSRNTTHEATSVSSAEAAANMGAPSVVTHQEGAPAATTSVPTVPPAPRTVPTQQRGPMANVDKISREEDHEWFRRDYGSYMVMIDGDNVSALAVSASVPDGVVHMTDGEERKGVVQILPVPPGALGLRAPQ